MISKELLSSIPIFEPLSNTDFDVLAGLWQKRTLTKGQLLFRRGETGNSMFIVEKGSIEITVPVDGQEKETRVSLLHFGQFFVDLIIAAGQSVTFYSEAAMPNST